MTKWIFEMTTFPIWNGGSKESQHRWGLSANQLYIEFLWKERILALVSIGHPSSTADLGSFALEGAFWRIGETVCPNKIDLEGFSDLLRVENSFGKFPKSWQKLKLLPDFLSIHAIHQFPKGKLLWVCFGILGLSDLVKVIGQICSLLLLIRNSAGTWDG